jgi:hypothetical protein
VDFPWDFSEYSLPRAEALRVLRDGPAQRSGPSIYRAFIDFGLMREDIIWSISRDREATDGPIFDSLAFSIEPVILNDPQEDEQFQVGWLSFAVHGPGYLFPYTYEESIARLRAQPALVEVREICRSMWPASTSPVPDAVLDGRRQMGKLWADPVDAPWDWYWAINETY